MTLIVIDSGEYNDHVTHGVYDIADIDKLPALRDAFMAGLPEDFKFNETDRVENFGSINAAGAGWTEKVLVQFVAWLVETGAVNQVPVSVLSLKANAYTN